MNRIKPMWLADLPNLWRTANLGHVASVGTGSADVKDSGNNGAYPFVVRSPKLLRLGQYTHDTEAVLTAGDGNVGEIFHHLRGKFAAHQRVYVIESGPELYGRYLYYAMKGTFLKSLQGNTAKSTVESLRRPMLTGFTIPLPPLGQQMGIADYLDHETAEIDQLIDNLESFDDIYSERQMAQVSGLIAYPADLNTSHACASGIVKAKYLGDITLGKMLDTRQADADSTMHPYLRAANVQPLGKLALEDTKRMRFTHREAERLTIKGGDVLVVEGGVGGYGRAAYVPQDIPDTGFQNSILRLRPNANADGRFIAYALLLLRHRGYMKMAASVTSMPHFTADKLANTPIPLMNLSRQTEIADELDAMWQRVDAVRNEGKRAIDLARERRAALITAAVTGQIDVTAHHKPAAEQLEDDIAQGLHREN